MLQSMESQSLRHNLVTEQQISMLEVMDAMREKKQRRLTGSEVREKGQNGK